MNWIENHTEGIYRCGPYTIYHGTTRYTLFATDDLGYRLVGGAETLLEAQLLASCDAAREKSYEAETEGKPK